MNSFRLRLLSTILGSVSLAVSQSRAGETLVQTSTIDALIKGIYDGGVNFAALKKVGDFGIGTLDDLDGEMLALDGAFFQITSDGKVHPIPDSAETPFSAMTFFKQDQALKLPSAKSFVELQKLLDAEIESPNLFHAIRITGTFTSISLRSVPRQSPPFPPLPEVVKVQSLFEYKNCPGTLVGFRCPSFVGGINVPGYHFHFISDDRKLGGHVLDCVLEKGEVSIDILENLKLMLPSDKAFQEADFSKHDEKSVDAVEKPAARGK